MEVAKTQKDGVAGIQRLIQEFVNDGEPSPKVREYLSTVINSDTLLLMYLKGREYRVNYAWETLKKNAEVRFNDYSEVFPDTLPEPCYEQMQRGFSGILKRRDEFGRRILCLNIVEWNPDEVSMEQLTAAMTIFADRLLLDEDAMTNGIILIQNCDGIRWKQARELTVPVMLRFLNVLWYAYPLKIEELYLINFPYYVHYVYNMIKPFLPKHFKEKLVISANKKFDLLHEKVSPKILPKFLGGVLENREALESDFLQRME